MLKQAISRESLTRPEEWESVLESLLLKVCASISPNVRSGDSLDARTYVKIKKIPGGMIRQSEYVDGIVITQNVAHKQMPRHMISPRIMILTFPLDYHRVENQLVSLEPLMAQEKNYLKHLTKRVTDLRPHVVLVEKTVSRLALDFLLEAKIAVARGVKPSAIQQVARCTQADIIASMDRLAMEPKLGRCAELKLQTFEHSLIPGYRKTYMRFEGCHEEFGCSLIVRGADLSTLVKVKAIADFMVLVVMNLKMEMAVYYDEQNILPPDAEPQAAQLQFGDINGSVLISSLGRSSNIGKQRQEQFDSAEKQTAEIEASLAPYLNTALSTSSSVHYPPPAPLAKMGLLDQKLRSLLLERDEKEAAQILLEESQGKIDNMTPTEELNNNPSSEDTPSAEAYVTTTPTAKTILADSAISGGENSKDMTGSLLVLPSEIKLESEIAQTAFRHAEQMKVWAWYRKNNSHDIRPQVFQGLTYIHATVCEGSDKPCTGPELVTHNFYAEDDCALGQYLERLSMAAAQPCENKTCTRIRLHHFQVLVHGKTRLQIAVDQFPCPSPGNENNVITWSYCKVCKEASPTAIIKEETWKFSWAKYLEHAFYPPSIRGGFGCPHDVYRDQIRYFAIHNVAIRIHNEETMVYDVHRPSLKLQTRLETRVILKNAEYEIVSGKLNNFFDSVLLKLRTFDMQLVESKKVSGRRVQGRSILCR
jgi:1-phosphatidylinositol-3-phosphate 5-kinase